MGAGRCGNIVQPAKKKKGNYKPPDDDCTQMKHAETH
jgi:hypothetical protein